MVGTKVYCKKDRPALLAFLHLVLESFTLKLDNEKMTKENWEIHRVLNVGVD